MPLSGSEIEVDYFGRSIGCYLYSITTTDEIVSQERKGRNSLTIKCSSGIVELSLTGTYSAPITLLGGDTLNLPLSYIGSLHARGIPTASIVIIDVWGA